MKNYLINYILENKKIIKVLLIFLGIGFLIGIMLFCMLTDRIRDELINLFIDALNMTKEENFNKINIILNGSIKYIIVLIILYISSFLILGENISIFFITIKGLLIGLYSSIIMKVFGSGNGFLSILLIIVIPNLIYIPAFLFTLINCKIINFNILCKKISPSFTAKQIINAIVSISIMFLSLVVEQSLCSIVINIWNSL